jgi:hypothetical protein
VGIESDQATMKRLLMLAAVLESVTGLALLIAPSVVAWLLLGAELPAVAAVVARLTGCALVALGIACRPGGDAARVLIPAARAMLTYNALVACYLTFLGSGGQFVGVLLWPVAAIHGLIALLLLRELWKTSSSQDTKG